LKQQNLLIVIISYIFTVGEIGVSWLTRHWGYNWCAASWNRL